MEKTIKRLVIAFAVGVIFYSSFGIFVIQPIGGVQKGATVLYFRLGLDVSFISSADGFIIENDKNVSFLARGLAAAKFAVMIRNRKIVTLPYSSTLYHISTGGVESEK